MRCAVGLLSTFPSVIGAHSTRSNPEFVTFMIPPGPMPSGVCHTRWTRFESGPIRPNHTRTAGVEKRTRSHSPTLICIELICFSYKNLLQNSGCHLEQLLRLHCFGQEV